MVAIAGWEGLVFSKMSDYGGEESAQVILVARNRQGALEIPFEGV